MRFWISWLAHDLGATAVLQTLLVQEGRRAVGDVRDGQLAVGDHDDVAHHGCRVGSGATHGGGRGTDDHAGDRIRFPVGDAAPGGAGGVGPVVHEVAADIADAGRVAGLAAGRIVVGAHRVVAHDQNLVFEAGTVVGVAVLDAGLLDVPGAEADHLGFAGIEVEAVAGGAVATGAAALDLAGLGHAEAHQLVPGLDEILGGTDAEALAAVGIPRIHELRRDLLVDPVGDRLDLAVPDGQRAPVASAALRALIARVASVGVLALVVGAVAVAVARCLVVAGHGAGLGAIAVRREDAGTTAALVIRGARALQDVALNPDVVDVHVRAHVGVGVAVLRVPPDSGRRHDADLEAGAQTTGVADDVQICLGVLERLEVRRRGHAVHLPVGAAHDRFLRVAAVDGSTGVQALDHAGGDIHAPHVRGFGLDPELAGDVEVALVRLEVRRVRIATVVDVVGERRDLDVAEHLAGEHVEPQGRFDQVQRPVHAHVVALVPDPIRRVFRDDVEVLTGLRVVSLLDVEVLRDRVSGDDGAVGLTLDPLVVRAGGDLIRLAGDQHVLGDFPLDAVHTAPRADAHHRLGLGAVHHEVSPVEDRIVRRIRDLPDEELLGKGIRLNLVDRLTLLGAAHRVQRDESKACYEPSRPSRVHAVLLQDLSACSVAVCRSGGVAATLVPEDKVEAVAV